MIILDVCAKTIEESIVGCFELKRLLEFQLRCRGEADWHWYSGGYGYKEQCKLVALPSLNLAHSTFKADL